MSGPERTEELDLFFDPRRSTRQFTQVVELGLPHVTTTLHFNFSHLGAVRLERSFYAHTVGDLANRKGGVEATIALANHHAFKGLQTLAVTFTNPYLHDNRVAGRKFWGVLTELLVFESPALTVLCVSLAEYLPQ